MKHIQPEQLKSIELHQPMEVHQKDIIFGLTEDYWIMFPIQHTHILLLDVTRQEHIGMV